MEKRVWGYTGWKVPVFGQGTWRMESDDRASCIAALKRGIELGLTHIDTAELYGSGGLGATTGFLYTAAGVGALLGPPLAGWIVDASGSYRPAIGAARSHIHTPDNSGPASFRPGTAK